MDAARTTLRYQAFLPFAELHADVIVADYPPGLPAYTTQLGRSIQRQIRERLLPTYAQAFLLGRPPLQRQRGTVT